MTMATQKAVATATVTRVQERTSNAKTLYAKTGDGQTFPRKGNLQMDAGALASLSTVGVVSVLLVSSRVRISVSRDYDSVVQLSNPLQTAAESFTLSPEDSAVSIPSRWST